MAMEATDMPPCSVFILGASGEVGKELLNAVSAEAKFSEIVLIGRRKIEEEPFMKYEQRVVDFEKIEDYGNAFQDLEIGFCCLGTTRGKAGVDGFIKVDHDYVVNSAKIAKQHGCKHLLIVSSSGANHNSKLLYHKTKGLTEEDLKDVGFDRLSIFRPGFLLCNRQEFRPLERAALTVMKPLFSFFPTLMSVPTSYVAKAMVKTALTPNPDKVEIIENKAMHTLASQDQ
ncbi:oxidoreductase HTATIP2-like [Limulus polyphemus]|uniref:Protein HTATIP2 n=1 Tax=Limulus polyphemus TaxID=6850 RepID=A0ABM1BV53_LIMPO|nr:oxidoreductase HTATIP2-like [Limulus polyphemus]XP_022258326.1 oxidoreductase HTATIP2-like [Limulus polyphemus]